MTITLIPPHDADGRDDLGRGTQLYKLYSADELALLPPQKWLVQDVFPETGLVSVFGASGCGKSFFILDLMAAISEGKDWFDHPTSSCPIVYLALEGEHGIKLRVDAIKASSGAVMNQVFFMMEPFSLLDTVDVDALVKSIQLVGFVNGMVVIDTLNRAAPGADENSGRDMGLIIAAAKRIQIAIGGLVLLVHHSGKDASRGLRGHSSLHAALDVAVEISRTGDSREWKLAKSKDGADGNKYPFTLKVVELGLDANGHMQSSCVVDYGRVGPNTPKAIKLGGNETKALEVISTQLKNQTQDGVEVDSAKPRIKYRDAVLQVGKALDCDERRKTERAKLAINGLTVKSAIIWDGDWISSP